MYDEAEESKLCLRQLGLSLWCNLLMKQNFNSLFFFSNELCRVIGLQIFFANPNL